MVALAGPFLVQLVLAPLILQSQVRSSTAVLLSQGMLFLLAGAVIATFLGGDWDWPCMAAAVEPFVERTGVT
jgi:hypothetical protein